MANGLFLYDLVGYGHHQCGGLEWVAKVAHIETGAEDVHSIVGEFTHHFHQCRWKELDFVDEHGLHFRVKVVEDLVWVFYNNCVDSVTGM